MDPTRAQIASLLVRRCNNCYDELPGYQVTGKGWNWITQNFGPFCDECISDITPAECRALLERLEELERSKC